MRIQNTKVMVYILLIVASAFGACSTRQDVEPNPIPKANYFTTSFDKTLLLSSSTIQMGDGDILLPAIKVDTQTTFQTIDGFGYTLTGGSAYLIEKMEATSRDKLIKELFGCDEGENCVNYLRISLGASDLSETFFTYDEMPAGQTDPTLAQFNLSRDTLNLIPLLKRILSIQPQIKIMASPWTAPLWMKTNGQSVGGNLKTEYQGVYADYFVKYINAMKKQGIHIDAVTIQNEPQHGGNNPSMIMSFTQQADFIKNHLGPAFKGAALDTKIIIWDHNCDNPGYPISILNDAAAKAYVYGSAFHLYAGDISALSQVHDAHPDRQLYFTEQWTGANSDFAGDLEWHLKNVIIGSMRNWSRVALEWNLANDPAIEPHTPGGCTQCKGALTIDGAGNITRNVSYYIIAHAARFVPPGSVRIGSTLSIGNTLHHVAFRTPDGKTALVVLNESSELATFNIQYHGKWVVTSLYGGNAGTYVF